MNTLTCIFFCSLRKKQKKRSILDIQSEVIIHILQIGVPILAKRKKAHSITPHSILSTAYKHKSWEEYIKQIYKDSER